MHAWEAIQKSVDYMEDHLSENLTIEALAAVAALSPYYFQRLFGRLVKKPVNEYMKLRRLAKASEALKSKDRRIIDVALEYGFSDHANFSRAFKDTYGLTPDDFRSSPVILNHFIKPDLLLNYVMVDEDVPVIADGIVVEVTRRKLDRPRIFNGIESIIPVDELTDGRVPGIAVAGRIWEDFHHRKHNIPHLLPHGNEIGVVYIGNAGKGCCTYMAGAEAAQMEQMEEYVSYTLPCGEYVVCCLEAENFSELIGSAIYKAIAFMNNWMKKHNVTGGKFTAELYYDTKPDANHMELWLPVNSEKRMQISEKTWDKNNGTHTPSIADVTAYVNNPLFEHLCTYLETEYQSKPLLEYSRCSMQYGWNIKYKKAGRTLCTLYPMEGYFIALIVIGEHERMETEMMLPLFTEYLQTLYHETKTGMGQKWLMINVTEETIVEDVKRCIAIRRNKRSK